MVMVRDTSQYFKRYVRQITVDRGVEFIPSRSDLVRN